MFFDNQCFTNKMVLLCKFQKEGYVSIQKKVLRKKTITFYEDKFLLLRILQRNLFKYIPKDLHIN